MRKRENRLDVALHFESPNQQENYERLKLIQDREAPIRQGTDLEFETRQWGQKWAEARFRLPLDERQPTPEIAPEAGSVMKTLIDRTYPILQSEIFGAAG